ncbi:DUF3800 domain-containing protein [Terrilactibacillus laevilacticus]|uniref:DUF3800 domain-containing protein n=1 Tax=Terrilactibacillus laevilacticus TaxID=1380157 RepID=A0ABW5PMG0_9BACI|nr:DUF3800 domain-containing protein [Terrilactibacillus laevilacticus]
MSQQSFSNYSVKVFFDESGKNQSRPHLMGGILIPNTYYNTTAIQELNNIIKHSKIHWTDYKGHSKTRQQIWKILCTVLEKEHLLSMNVISYNQSKIEENSKHLKETYPDIADQTIFMKFPERIVYGLIRGHGTHLHLDADIYIEDDSTYHNTSYDLRDQLLKQLNIQSIYRGERFTINNTDYLPKQTEVGIEITDILLGIVRSVLRNDLSASRSSKEKNKFIISLLNANPKFHQFLKKVKYYEWDNSHELINIDFENYLNIFIGSNLA